jgi:CheY-like chemotaxis protein
MIKFLKKFFKRVISAADGESGLKKYLQERPDIIITDIEMPDMSGLDMIKKIKQINKEVPVLVMSAYDEKEYLLDSIRYGVVNYLKKPAQTSELSQALLVTIKSVKSREDKDIFVSYLQHAFDYQNNMIILMENGIPLVANPILLNYFKVASVEEFVESYGDIGSYFMEHDKFLFTTSKRHWLEAVIHQPEHHFHVKMLDYGTPQNMHHFLLQYHDIPEKSGYGLLLLDDITELNLLDMFELSSQNPNGIFKNKTAIKDALNLITERNLQVKIHNFYKGLSITNPTTIIEADENTIVLKSNTNQLRASEYENFIIINCDALPHFIICKEIVAVNYEKNIIVASQIYFMSSSPTQRKNIRIEPTKEHSASFVYKDNRYDDTLLISDISVDAVKLHMNAKPVDLEISDSVFLNLTLKMPNDRNININTAATVIRTQRHQDCHHVVFSYELKPVQKRDLVEYIASRQMELIREFKRI